MLSNLQDQLKTTIEGSLRECFPSQNDFPPFALEVPNDKQHGEFACNIALRLSGILKKNPLEIAGILEGAIQKNITSGPLRGKIDKMEIKNPGFINFFLSTDALYEVLAQVLQDRENFGRQKETNRQKIQIEFVSANPTGPLSVAHARQAAVGDALGNILNFIGHKVTKEFYVNDEGNQVNILGRSIQLRGLEIFGETVDFPEDCYQGEYILDMARVFIEEHKIKDANTLRNVDPNGIAQFGAEFLLDVIKKELEDFGVHFDVWSHQSKIATAKNTLAVLNDLRTKDFIYDLEGAVWFKSSVFGDDKDRVVKKSDGSYTYLLPDIVYHRDKFERGFQKVINIWGPDHHGYIPRLKAAVAALGQDPKSLEILIVQLATIFRDGKPLSMSTRRGQYISLREVMEEVGVDAARFFFLMRHINAQLEFDLELAKKQTPENPVFYVQYAHARICSIINLAKESKLLPKRSGFERLKEAEEIDLLKTIGHFPETLTVCSLQLDPFMLVVYLQGLANSFHKFYDKHRVVSEDAALSAERLGLIEAARIVLANGLKLLGINAPTKM